MLAGGGHEDAAVCRLRSGRVAAVAEELERGRGGHGGDQDGGGDAPQLQGAKLAVGEHGDERGLVVTAHVGGDRADPRLAVAPGDVSHEVVEGLGDRGVARVRQGASTWSTDQPASRQRRTESVVNR